VTDFSDEKQITNQLLKIYDDWKHDKLNYSLNVKDIEQFERKYLTKKLNVELNKLIATNEKQRLRNPMASKIVSN
jgi:hypothetical protein